MRNPLRSRDASVRLRVSEGYLREAHNHLKALENRLAEATLPEELCSLSHRLTATRAYLDSWNDYILAGCPLEPRAQITPTIQQTLLRV
jgi:hypothetical protein